MRYCPIIATIREIAAGEQIQYLSFKFVGGMVDRYSQQKVEWVTDRAISGGGPLLTNDRQRTTREMKLTNVFFYPEFVRDTLRRVQDGRPPIADLADNAAAVALIEGAYAMSPIPGS